MAMVMVKAWLEDIVSPFFGLVNFEDGMLPEDGMRPIGAGLHEPAAICCPFVRATPGAVRQKLMKLFVEVLDAT